MGHAQSFLRLLRPTHSRTICYRWQSGLTKRVGRPLRTRYPAERRAHFDLGLIRVNRLPEVRYSDAGIERVIFKLPPARAPERGSILIFALPKSGSVLLNMIMRDLSNEVGLCYVAIMDEYFKFGVPEELQPASTSEIFLSRGYCYGSFRSMPTYTIPIIGDLRKVLLVRDPRDMLVSHYYSMLASHPPPGISRAGAPPVFEQRDLARQLDIDSYVKQTAPAYRGYFEGYRVLCTSHGIEPYRPRSKSRKLLRQLGLAGRALPSSKVRVYRYEDVVYARREWVLDLCEWFGLTVPLRRQYAIAKQHDIFPSRERQDKHIRQVHPKNYKLKLADETIRFLEDFFRDEMKFFGYPA